MVPNLYEYKGTKAYGIDVADEKVIGEIVANNEDQAITLLNRANINVRKITCRGKTKRTIESTLP